MALVALLFLAACGASDRTSANGTGAGNTAADARFEVWVVDQSDSDHAQGIGGTIYIYDGSDLTADRLAAPEPVQRVDLAMATAELCRSGTGSNPTRPHMLRFDREGTHAVLAFWQTGHVVLLDADSREPLACVRTSPGTGEAQQARDAYPAPDGSFVLVTNQDGKTLERIETDFSARTFNLNSAARLDLATGTTPAGLPTESANHRPDVSPVCAFIDAESRYAWITLRGGGLFVVDPLSTPMQIVAEYDGQTVKGHGCGAAQAGDAVFIDSGAAPGTYALGGFDFEHDHTFAVYRFPTTGYQKGSGPNLPEAQLMARIEGERDSQGMILVQERFLWVADRHADTIEVFDVVTGDAAATLPLTGAHTQRAAPELLTISPSGSHVFVTLRGPTPIFGDPHNAHGSIPALGVIEVEDGGRGGRLLGLVRLTNVLYDQEMADPRAVGVRRVR